MNRERTEAMNDREALARALNPVLRDYGWLKVLEDAARERLAQLPEKCERCNGEGRVPTIDQYDERCPSCRGGKVYPAELVERVWTAIDSVDTDYTDFERRRVVAVLDALNGETE